MTKRRKSSRIDLEEDIPEIAVDLLEEPRAEKENLEEIEKTPKIYKDRKKESVGTDERIKQKVESVKSKEGVIGYILRNSTSASIDLKDPAKIIDYAVLSSSAFEASEELSETFKLGEVKYSLIKGDTVKLLSFINGENKISVFMENNIDHKRIYKDLSS